MAEERLEEIRKLRLEKRQQLLDAGVPAYPAEVRRTHTLKEIDETFDELEKDTTPLMVLGRVTSVRSHGGVVFIDLRDEAGELQLQVTKDEVEPEVFERLELLDSGDWISATGMAGKTKRGVNTLMVKEWHMASKAIRPLPSEWYGLKDHETRYREREVDLLLNPEVKETFMTRSRIIHWLREYLAERGYIEMETPVLEHIHGGAAARPFVTHHNVLDQDLYLRIAAEIPLKRLLTAGFEKVFEIGPRFRNEGVDRQHNPQFTMLESQWAYADYEDLMDFTEECFEALAQDITGSIDVVWQGQTLSFKRPFKRLRYVDIMSEKLGFDILEEKDPAVYVKIFEKENLELPEAQNYYQLVDELYKELVRPGLVQPTFVYDYPAEMAPLAKRSASDPRVAEKFQTLIAGLEVTNSYTELNDPVMQREILEEQLRNKEAGDDEAYTLDEDYLRSMEYGMPPNVGWGVGVDRLVMLLTDSPSIRDTILFPLLRPDND